ncbi:molybdopterin converting factor, subunit 1 [Palaeococcus pacificus DY20341]|uniref:Molybdopterin converting factor, subunit 1 n=1 Tax=Palaeococcus pacificus DY20341 TaxID=1343739 RepID=A0A075LTS8_9EURY|nr:MoaD/ThiS family protein [Palaeococcus pacificus]AIF70110.1 molybdopterin converting factor, subunit 1 [Palaeococcus pacificus DY20341]
MVKIKLMGLMAHLAKARELEVKLDGPKTVDELLREVIPRYDELHDKIILVNGVSAKGNYVLKDDDEVKVMPVLSGG